MRIAILTDSFPPYLSGVITHFVELARSLLKKGHQVLILTANHPEKSLPKGLEEARVVYLPSFQTHVPRLRVCFPNTLRVILEIRNFKADLIETDSPSFLGIDGLVASKILRTPRVSAFYTLFTSREYLQVVFNFEGDFLQKLIWSYHRWFYNSSDMIGVPTDGVADLLVRNRIARNKIEKLPLLFDFYNVKALREEDIPKTKVKYDLRDKVAIFVGRISSEKRLDFLIHVWSHVVEEYEDSSLLIVGGGLYEMELKKLVRRYSLDNHVRMVGPIDHEELLSSGLISACDLFVSVSTSETLGLAGIEAMAHGIPVVLAQSQGLAEIVGGAGIVCPPNDLQCFKTSILQIFKDENLKSEMGKAAKNMASNYGSSSVVNEVFEKYRALCARG